MTNLVILTGHLGADPDVRHVGDGVVLANARLASTEYYRDKASDEMKEVTEWHRLVFFGRLAEVAAKYLVKGSRVHLQGSLRTRKWQAGDGQDRYSTEVLVRHLEMMGGARADAPRDDPASTMQGHDGLDDWTREYDQAAMTEPAAGHRS